MASDSVTRVPDAVESRGPAESAETTEPPESTLPPTSDLVLPYQSRAADRERLPALDEQAADRQSGEDATETDPGASSEETLAGTDSAKRSLESARVDERLADRDQTTLADLRSTHRELIAGLDSQRPDSPHLNTAVADPEVVSEAHVHDAVPVVEPRVDVAEGDAVQEIDIRGDGTTADADRKPSFESESSQTQVLTDAPDAPQQVADHGAGHAIVEDHASVRSDDSIAIDQAKPAGLSIGHDSKDLQGRLDIVGQDDPENARTISIWAHPNTDRVDDALGQYLIRHPSSREVTVEVGDTAVRGDGSLSGEGDRSSVGHEPRADAGDDDQGEGHVESALTESERRSDRPDAGIHRDSPTYETVSDSSRTSTAEQELRSRVVDTYSKTSIGGSNEAFEVQFEDGTNGLYKPSLGEKSMLRIDVPPGEYWNREVAASRLDELLDLGLVPVTTEWQGPHGVGSMQEWDGDATRGLFVQWYPRPDLERMAVLDYISGNLDRHEFNYLTDIDQHPVAIDHGCSFPEGAFDPIRSDFVAELLGEPLSDEMLDKVRSVEESELVGTLESAGLSEAAVDGARARFREIKDHGMITGHAWPGKITDAHWQTVR